MDITFKTKLHQTYTQLTATFSQITSPQMEFLPSPIVHLMANVYLLFLLVEEPCAHFICLGKLFVQPFVLLTTCQIFY